MEKEMQYYVMSFSHKKTPLHLREKLAFLDEKEILSFLNTIKDETVPEIILLSTCNRLEFYCYTSDGAKVKQRILEKLVGLKQIDLAVLEESLETYEGIGAVHHIFCVASSLDSVVVGETQIVGQLKNAYRFCLDSNLCSKNFTRLIHFAFKCAARVRNQTQISDNVTSVASVAVHQAKKLQKQFNLAKKALVIGMGEMSILSAKHLLSDGYEILICNRNQQKIQDFIEQYPTKERAQIKSCNFDDLQGALQEYHFVFSATASSSPIILDSMVEDVAFDRFWFDLAVPRDIEDITNKRIQIFVVDDLKQIAEENLNSRREHAHRAYEIIGIATMEFSQWLQTLEIEPLIKKIRELAKEASLRELQRAIKKGYIPAQYQFNVEKILHQAFNVFLHQPTQNLRNQANKQESDIIIESIKNFFGIHKDTLLINTYKCEYDTSSNKD
ncbi:MULTISPECIES: glutamyl-tRNA reductase [unclassified Helicobacter]|uniref:glutamyl-tRNA reductase n=1 Tax=unclassified Helicobacter TaxID=2593540 RepID=UPI000CF1A27E|nr:MULTISPECIES: glutamyl-tRNA reductase [unclassified Helicobacter]